MFGGTSILTGKLLTLIATTTCPAMNMPFSVQFDVSMQPEQISQSFPSTLKPTSNGNYTLEFKNQRWWLDFRQQKVLGTDTSCLYLYQATYHVDITPTIYVNSKYHPGECVFDAIRKHYETLVTQAQISFNNYQSSFTETSLTPLKNISFSTPLKPTEVISKETEVKAQLDPSFKAAWSGLLEYMKQRDAQLALDGGNAINAKDCH
jgi:hypothetical protein